ncbi:MAG TPA: glutathione ABC transporter permease, partial [bacterium]|nr:glutathione ABC transporter permease [bacterium]
MTTVALSLQRIQARTGWLARFIRRNPTGTAAGIAIFAMAVIAVLAPWVTPYDPLANDFTSM